jgi:hypothetical protein
LRPALACWKKYAFWPFFVLQYANWHFMLLPSSKGNDMQTNLKSFFGIRVYIVVADYNAQGVAYAMDPTHNFDDAVLEWSDQMERGNECCDHGHCT